MMTDYRVTLRVRNARILRALEGQGYASVAEFCRTWGFHQSDIGALIGMKKSVVASDGRLTPTAEKLCEALCALPEELWSEDQLYGKPLLRNTAEFEISPEDIAALGSRQKYLQIGVEKLMETAKLTANERKVLIQKVMHDVPTGSLTKQLDVSRSRLGQIESNALRKMRKANWDKPIFEQDDCG